jgi:hypothetical protein
VAAFDAVMTLRSDATLTTRLGPAVPFDHGEEPEEFALRACYLQQSIVDGVISSSA